MQVLEQLLLLLVVQRVGMAHVVQLLFCLQRRENNLVLCQAVRAVHAPHVLEPPFDL